MNIDNFFYDIDESQAPKLSADFQAIIKEINSKKRMIPKKFDAIRQRAYADYQKEQSLEAYIVLYEIVQTQFTKLNSFIGRIDALVRKSEFEPIRHLISLSHIRKGASMGFASQMPKPADFQTGSGTMGEFWQRYKRPSNTGLDSLNDNFFSDYHSRMNHIIKTILSKISELETARISEKSNQKERLRQKVDEISETLSWCYDALDEAFKRGENGDLSHSGMFVEDFLDVMLKKIEKNHLSFPLAQEVIDWGKQYKVPIYNIMNNAGCLGEHTDACVGSELPENFWELPEKDQTSLSKQLAEKLISQLTPIIIAFDKIVEKHT